MPIANDTCMFKIFQENEFFGKCSYTHTHNNIKGGWEGTLGGDGYVDISMALMLISQVYT